VFGYGMAVVGDGRTVAGLRGWLALSSCSHTTAPSATAYASPEPDRWSWVGFSAVLDVLDDATNFELVGEMLGRPPLADVWFHLENKTDDDAFEDAQRRLLVTAVRLAVELDLEAVLAFQGDSVMMRRRRGQVVLYDEWPQWSDPAVLDRLGVPFVTTDRRETY
jgi:hypothetical protein